MRHVANEKGVALIGAVAVLLILSLMGVVVASLVGTESYSALHQLESAQALPLAEAGAHRAVGYLSREGGECEAISDNLQFTKVALGRGTFSVMGTRYNPTPTALSADIGAADTTIPVVSTAGYAPHGSITIESETIYYAGTTPTSFTGARRGAAGTTAASHSASSADIVMDWTIAETVDWVMGAVVLTAAGSPSPGIAFDAAGSVVQNATAASFTWSHTVSGSNRILVVGVSMRNKSGETVSGVTYAGTPLTFVGTRDNEISARVEIWRLVAPAVGTDNVVVTLSASAKIVGSAVSLTGVDQATPVAASSFTAGSSTNPNLTLNAVATSAWVIDALAFRSTGSSTPTATPGGGQVQRASGFTESGGQPVNIRGKASTEQPGQVHQDQCLIASTGIVGLGANGTSGITFDKFIAFDQSDCDPCQWNHTVAAAATDRILVVSFGYGDDPNAIVGVTYNGI
ncbi:MAG: pilus assembly PilX N-terminal domain-containing protein, partial [candidate division NC10 bacterium]